MKKQLSWFLLVITLIISGTVFQARAASISFNVMDNYIQTGERFDVEVYAQEDIAAGNLTRFGFLLTSFYCFDYFFFDDYSLGSDFTDEGLYGYVAGANENNTNAGSNVLLATLSFTAMYAGTDNLWLCDIGPEEFYGLSYEMPDYFSGIDAVSQIITIHDVSPVPEPASMWFLGTGIIGLLGFCKMRLYG